MTNCSCGGFLMDERMNESEGLGPEGLSPVDEDAEVVSRVRRGAVFVQAFADADAQRAFLKAVAQEVDLYFLVQESGYKTVGRYWGAGGVEQPVEALSRLIADVASGAYDVDAVLASDLLGLGRGAAEWYEVRKALHEHGVELVLSSEQAVDCEPECEWSDLEEDDEAAE